MRANIQIYNQDCMIGMKEFPDNHFDIAITDPPYGINVNMQMGRKKGEKPRYEKKDWDKETPNEDYFNELLRVSKNQIIWGGNYFTNHLPASMGWICWDKEVPSGVSFSDFELAWTSFNQAAKKVRIPYCGFIGLNGNKRLHPTEKPTALYKWLLKNYAKLGDKILDTHWGSGSIGIACWDMGFDLTAFEIDEGYYKAAIKRLEEHKAKLQLFEPVRNEVKQLTIE